MKTMKSVIVGIALVFLNLLFGIVAMAAPPMPVGGQDTIREFALATVVSGQRSIEATSMVWSPDRPNWVEVEGNGAEDVLNQLLAKKLVMEVVNPADEVTGRIWLFDRDGNCLWYGRSSYQADSKALPAYNLWIQDIFLLEDVQRASVYILDEDGKTIGQQGLEIRNGQVVFQSWMAGMKNAVMTVWFEDGQVISWSLDDGSSSNPSNVSSVGGSWHIEGHRIVQSDDPVVSVDFTTIVVPTVLVTIKDGQSLRVRVVGFIGYKGSDNVVMFEWPTEMVVTSADGESVKVPLNNGTPTDFQQVEPGVYRLRFEWPTLWQDRSMGVPTPSVGGGDSGGGNGGLG